MVTEETHAFTGEDVGDRVLEQATDALGDSDERSSKRHSIQAVEL